MPTEAPVAEPVQTAPATTEPAPAPETTAEAPSLRDLRESLTDARVSGANPETIARLQKQVDDAKVKSQQEPAPEPAPEVIPEPETAPEVAPETPETEPETTEEPPAGEEPPEEEPEGKGKGDRIRLGSYSEEDRALVKAADVLVKNLKIPFAEAFARVSGTNIPKAAVPEVPQVSPEVSALEEQVTGLKTKMRELSKDGPLFNEEIAELQIELTEAVADLRDQRNQEKNQKATTEAVEQARFKTEQSAELKRLRSDYPALNDTKSPLCRLAQSIAESMRLDPTDADYDKFDSATAPRIATERAAHMLGVKPASQPAVSPAAQPIPPKAKALVPVPGSRQTNPPPPAKSAEQRRQESEERTLAMTEGRSVRSRGNSIVIL